MKPFVGRTDAELVLHRKKWADYHRLKARPNKACCKCGVILENTDKFFAVGNGSRLSSTCKRCQAGINSKRMASVPMHGPCLACGEKCQLVVQRRASTLAGREVRLCRRCSGILYYGQRDPSALRNLGDFALWMAANVSGNEGLRLLARDRVMLNGYMPDRKAIPDEPASMAPEDAALFGTSEPE